LPHNGGETLTSRTVDGVTTIDYLRNGNETIVSVFSTTVAAQHAIEEEARMGDAHDQRVGRVLYNDDGPARKVIAACIH
jgi:hypothetical protein